MDIREKRERYKKWMIIGYSIAGVSWLLLASIVSKVGIIKSSNIEMIVFISFGIGGFIGRYYQNQYNRLDSGIIGEEKTRNILRDLPSNYKVLPNVRASFNGKSAEIDFLVVSSRGICIVEAKNYNGKLEGNENDNEWVYTKVSSGRRKYRNKIRNPLKQVNRQVYIVSNLLKGWGIKCWVESYVYILNANCCVHSDRIFTNESSLLSAIKNSGKANKLSDEQISYIVKRLNSRS